MSPPVRAHAPEPEMRLMAADMQVGSFPAGVPPQVPGTLETCRHVCIWAAQCALRSETPHAVWLPLLRSPGRVALAVTRQGSHGPGRALINASGSSTDSLAIPEGFPRLSKRVAWTGAGASMGSTCFPCLALPADASLPSPGSSGASSPASTVLSKRYDFPPPIPPHFVAFAWRYLRGHSFFSLPDRRVRC